MDMEPELLGYYGVTNNQVNPKSGPLGIRYFRYPVEQEHHELSNGYIENNAPEVDDFGFGFVPYPTNRVRDELHHLLKWLFENQKHAKDEDGNLLKDMVLCDSKFLETVINSAYEEPNTPQKYAAKKYRGIIFIKRIRTNTRKSSIRDHAAWKFCEKFTEEIEPTDVETDCYSVHRLNVSGMNIFYSRRVHCIKERTFDPNRNDIVLLVTAPKTYRVARQDNLLHFPSLSSRVWWSQCLLSNANEVYVGKRDERKHGGSRKPYKILFKGHDFHNVADLQRVGNGYWYPETGFKELVDRFNQIKLEVVQDDHDIIHEYIITSKDNITHECKIVGDENNILSDDMLLMLDELEQNIVQE